jgi:hypothetical protein
MLRNHCPIGLSGHYKSEKIFTNLKMSARLQLRACAHSVVRRSSCVSADGGLCFRAHRLRTGERGKCSTQ